MPIFPVSLVRPLALTALTAQLPQEDDPDFLYKDWFFGTACSGWSN